MRHGLDLNDFDPNAVARLLAKVSTLATDDDGCWLWPWAMNGRYPRASLRLAGGGWRVVGVHQVVAATHGPIAPGDEAFHSCDTPLCVRRDHLAPGTAQKNRQEAWDRNPTRPRVFGTAAQRAAQTHCKRGHEFTPDNTYIASNGTRSCRACHAEAERARRAGKAAAR